MYKVIKQKDITKEYEDYKLVYVDNIPETYSDYTPETVEYMKTDAYLIDKEIYGWNNPKVEIKDYPNPDYIKGYQEEYAYFCNVPVNLVWGDDFDDIPYEHNSGDPYDTVGDEEITIIKVPFCIDVDNFIGSDIDVKEPKNYGINSHWSTEDINLGAIPWIFVRTCKWKRRNNGVSIMAGTKLSDFIVKLKEINNLIYDNLKDNLELVETFKGPIYAIRNKKTDVIRFYNDNLLLTPITYKPDDYLGYDIKPIFSVYGDDRDWIEIQGYEKENKVINPTDILWTLRQ